ncbi:MAG TPA: chemotaxis protein CheC [Armatimonadota bacterium]|jgi:chemotaxis protein CheC
MVDAVLNELQRDALSEVGNIGAGNATNALAIMTRQRLELSVPETHLVALEELPRLTADHPEEALVSVYVAFQGTAQGCLLLLFTEPQARALLRLLDLPCPTNIFNLPSLEKSAVSEIGNILASSYLNALAQFAGLHLFPLPPGVAVGMSGAILGSIGAFLGQLDDRSLVIHLRISAGVAGQQTPPPLGLRLVMIPRENSLQVILAALGLE